MHEELDLIASIEMCEHRQKCRSQNYTALRSLRNLRLTSGFRKRIKDQLKGGEYAGSANFGTRVGYDAGLRMR
jgi:hypothetical protein